MTKKIQAACKDTGSIHFTHPELCAKLTNGASYFQGRPAGMSVRVVGPVVRKSKEGEVLGEEEKEMTFTDVYTSAGGKKSPGIVTFFPAMSGAGEWKKGAAYSVEVTFEGESEPKKGGGKK